MPIHISHDNQLAHLYLSRIHFSRSCDNLIVMSYFNTQSMKTILKSSSSSSSSFYLYSSRKYIIRISKAEPKLVHYRNYNNVQFFVFKTDLNNALKCCPSNYKWLWSYFYIRFESPRSPKDKSNLRLTRANKTKTTAVIDCSLQKTR